ncbi:C40 family peptidase [Galbibacter sp. EGI 63066]|uniref:C40 family peptidase n=1 Tax=Galbibacter sp. EGI 63066 TaxID=2993559 RepID=UPI002248C967|nr:C40 family peptidase [Galbibacter sp. EGI 63066]MCX2679961.1 C40 family peptidase [Galbibacter sp. EGI 63066]
MLKNLFLLTTICIAVASCKSSKKAAAAADKPIHVEVKSDAYPEKTSEKTNRKAKKGSKKTNNIINTALSYHGTPYRYGGTTKKGMDCSGLVYTSFKQNNLSLQRSSRLMASQGRKIKLKNVEKGDLLFFTTSKNRRRINHVGLVVEVKGRDIKFIHSTTSRGVLVSSLGEGYWNHAFNHARRIL